MSNTLYLYGYMDTKSEEKVKYFFHLPNDLSRLHSSLFVQLGHYSINDYDKLVQLLNNQDKEITIYFNRFNIHQQHRVCLGELLNNDDFIEAKLILPNDESYQQIEPFTVTIQLIQICTIEPFKVYFAKKFDKNISIKRTWHYQPLDITKEQENFINAPYQIEKALQKKEYHGFDLFLNSKRFAFMVLKETGESCIFLWNIVIDRKMQNKGYGQYILEMICQYLKDFSFLRITATCGCDNLAGLHLYEKCGFQVLSEVCDGDICEINYYFDIE